MSGILSGTSPSACCIKKVKIIGCVSDNYYLCSKLFESYFIKQKQNKMKKSIFAIAALSLGMTLAACGNSNKGGEAAEGQENQTEEQAAENAEAVEAQATQVTEEPVAPKAEDFKTPEEFEAAVNKYNELKAQYEAGKQAVTDKIQEGVEAVENVKENVEQKVEAGKQAVEQVKQDVDQVKKDAENVKNTVEGLKNMLK